MSEHTLFVCELCQFAPGEPTREGQSGGQHLIDHLRTELAQGETAASVTLRPVRCMAGCRQACNASLAAPGKLTYILHQLSPQTAAPDLVAFVRQYLASVDGRVPYHTRSATIQQATAYVLPPLPAAPAPHSPDA